MDVAATSVAALIALIALLALLAPIAAAPLAAGSAPPDLVVPMTPAPIAIDGQSDPAWAAAAVVRKWQRPKT